MHPSLRFLPFGRGTGESLSLVDTGMGSWAPQHHFYNVLLPRPNCSTRQTTHKEYEVYRNKVSVQGWLGFQKIYYENVSVSTHRKTYCEKPLMSPLKDLSV